MTTVKYGINQCAICGNDFYRMRENHLCCSKKCTAKYWYNHHKKAKKETWQGQCRNCGKTFESTRSGGNPHYYCSPKCGRQYLDKQRLSGQVVEENITQECAFCGNDFTYLNNGYLRRFCSVKCRVQASRKTYQLSVESNNKLTLAKCPRCERYHKTSVYYSGTGTPRFFCESCSKRIMAMDYEDRNNIRRAHV